jgi:hypothetical protein
MATCDNCASTFDPSKDGLQVKHRGGIAASICEGCCSGVRVGKVVLRRGDVGGFTYEQWSPMETMASGLSSKRAG